MDAVQHFTKNTVQMICWSETPRSIVMKKYDIPLTKIVFERTAKNMLRLGTIRNILIDICDAMVACEKLGIVHNDLKPRK